MFYEEGHQTLYQKHNGLNGDLEVNIEINQNENLYREGNDIFTKHYITLGEAIRGVNVEVATA